MAKNWTYKIEIGEDMESLRVGTISLKEFGKNLAEKLKPILENVEIFYPSRYFELEDIYFEIRDMEEGFVDDIEEVDEILEQLYDFGDEDKILWVDTFY